MQDSAQVVIVGAGVMGLSVAYHLTARGVTDVLLLEQGPHAVAGSTARSAAGVRHQFSSEANVRLSLHSIARLRQFEDEIGADAGLRQVGYLFVIDRPADWAQYQRNVAMQRNLGVAVELLTPAEAGRIVPGLRTDDLLGATWGPHDGFCDAQAVAQGYLRRACERGARLRTATEVTAIERRGGRVVAVQTADGAIGCDVLVNAAGPWAGRLAALAGLDLPVRPVRRSLYVTEPFDRLPSAMPLTIDVGSGFWARKADDNVLMGLARKDEPSGFDTAVDWPWLATVQAAGSARIPALADARIATERCWAGLYEVTPDANPVLGRHPALANYVDISGFSGHGIMHAPAAGLLIAEEIVDGRAHSLPIDDFRIARFAQAASAERNVF